MLKKVLKVGGKYDFLKRGEGENDFRLIYTSLVLGYQNSKIQAHCKGLKYQDIRKLGNLETRILGNQIYHVTRETAIPEKWIIS